MGRYQKALLALCGAFLLALTACNSGSQGAEGLVIYTARGESIHSTAVEQFVAKYPEYEGKVEVFQMGAQEILERVRAEQANPQADFWWGGTVQQFTQAANEGLLEPTQPAFADLIDPAFKDPAGLWYGEMLLPEVIMYNTEALTPEQAPQSWDELIEPQWQGKIVIRGVLPSGTMRTIYSALIDRFHQVDGHPERGYEWLRKLDANTHAYAADPTDLYVRLMRSQAVVSLWNLQDVLLQANREGRPFGFVIPAEGVPILVDGIGVIKGAPNREAAIKFMEFIMSDEVRLALSEQFFQIPSIPYPEGQQPAWLEGVNLTPMELDWATMTEKEAEWMQYWDENIKGQG